MLEHQTIGAPEISWIHSGVGANLRSPQLHSASSAHVVSYTSALRWRDENPGRDGKHVKSLTVDEASSERTRSGGGGC